MKVNYVLMYGIPYVRYKEFETFEDVSKFLVNKSIVNYSIFKKLEDKEEVEMIYRDNDIHYLENFVKEQDRKLQQKENIIKEVREWAKKYSCQFTNDDGELVVSEISFNIQARPCDLFKILDKAGDSNERNK